METPNVTATTISVEHVTITSPHPFEAVRAALEASVPRLADKIAAVLAEGGAERALTEMEAAPPLQIFGFRNHGALLAVAGRPRRAIQYDIGNPLTASKMTRHHLSAALYAPVRVLLREDDAGVVAFEYDRPISTFGQFGNAGVEPVARQLDQDLQAALESAAGRSA